MSARAKPNRWQVAVWQIGLLLAFLLFWEWGTHLQIDRSDPKHTLIDPFFYASPVRIENFIAKWLASGAMWHDIGITMLETLLGLAIGGFIGILLGIVLASNRWIDAIFEPVLVLLNAMPRVTLVPLFILWFGFSIWSKVMGAIALVLFVVFFATYAGIKDVDATLVANARVLGADRFEIAKHVLLPSALTWIFASLRGAVGFALIGAVVAEYLGANAGIGYRIQYAEASLDTSGVFGGLTVLMVLVFIVDSVIRRIQQRLIVWKPAAL